MKNDFFFFIYFTKLLACSRFAIRIAGFLTLAPFALAVLSSAVCACTPGTKPTNFRAPSYSEWTNRSIFELRFFLSFFFLKKISPNGDRGELTVWGKTLPRFDDGKKKKTRSQFGRARVRSFGRSEREFITKNRYGNVRAKTRRVRTNSKFTGNELSVVEWRARRGRTEQSGWQGCEIFVFVFDFFFFSPKTFSQQQRL